jgi:hypothetical protein
MSREQSIMHDAPSGHYVYAERHSYTVYKPHGCAAITDSAYAKTPDGLSIAIARCNYLARKAA